MIGLIVILFFVLLLIGFPIAIAMGGTSAIAILLDSGLHPLVLAQKVYTANDSFALMAVPFFMLGGQIMEATHITDTLVNFSKKLVGFMRGGVAYTTVVTGVLMAGISGSANADAAAIGSITLNQMRKDGWDDGMSVSIVAAAGGLGPIIPPSIAMVIYCNLTGLSVGTMFLAGYLPGILLAIGYMIIAGLYARKHNMPRSRFEGIGSLIRSFGASIPARHPVGHLHRYRGRRPGRRLRDPAGHSHQEADLQEILGVLLQCGDQLRRPHGDHRDGQHPGLSADPAQYGHLG